MGVPTSKRAQRKALTNLKAADLASRVTLKKAKLLKKEARQAPFIAGAMAARKMNKKVTKKAYKIKKRQSKSY